VRTALTSTLRTRFKGAVSGSALIEFSLLLPILMGLMVGAFEFGRYFQQTHVVNKGVKNAARYLARIENGDLCPSPAGGSFANDTLDARDLAQYGSFDTTGKSLIIPAWDSSSTFTASVTCAPNPETGGIRDYRGPAVLPVIQVTTTFTYDDIGMLDFIRPSGLDITATHEELYIGG